jgi:hypothetical protein
MSESTKLGTPEFMNGPSELHMDFQPVLRLAIWTHREHEPVAGRCRICGTPACEPFEAAEQILEAAGELPYLVVRKGSPRQAA